MSQGNISYPSPSSAIGPHIEWTKLYEDTYSGTGKLYLHSKLVKDDCAKYNFIFVNLKGAIEPTEARPTLYISTGMNDTHTMIRWLRTDTFNFNIDCYSPRTEFVNEGTHETLYQAKYGFGSSYVESSTYLGPDAVSINEDSASYSFTRTIFGGNFVY